MQRRADQALGIGSAVAVAVVSTVLMVSASGAATGFSGGSTGGGILPAAGQDSPAPDPGTESPTPGASATPGIGLAGSTGGGGAGKGGVGVPSGGAAGPKDTGGYRSFDRLTNRGITWINGDATFVSEKAKIVLSPFSLEETVTSKVTRFKKTKTTVTRIVVHGHTERTSTDGGKTWQQSTLSDTSYAALYQSCDPKAFTRYARSLPGVSTRQGVHVGPFNAKGGTLGLQTSSMDFTLGALLKYFPKTLANDLAPLLTPVLLAEGIAGYEIADKYDRPWAVGANDIALPFAMGSIGMLYGGYQS